MGLLQTKEPFLKQSVGIRQQVNKQQPEYQFQ
jgi:hypothetical protein